MNGLEGPRNKGWGWVTTEIPRDEREVDDRTVEVVDVDRLEVVHQDRIEVVHQDRTEVVHADPWDGVDLPGDLPDDASGDGRVESRARVAEERRHGAPVNRLSWAVPLPFLLDGREPTDADELVRAAEKRRSTWVVPLQRRLVLGDAVSSLLAMGLSLWSLTATRDLALQGALLWSVAWVSLLYLARAYDRHRVGDGPDEFQSILRAGVLAVAVMGVVAFSLQLLLPRRAVLVAVPLTVLATAFVRWVSRQRLHHRRGRGGAMLRTLVVGEPLAVAQVTADLERERHHGLDVVGSCIPVRGPDIDQAAGTEVLGLLSQVPQVVVDHAIDAVIVVGSRLTGPSLRRLSWALESTGADLMVAPGLIEVTGPHVSLRPAAGLSLLRVERPSDRSGRLLGKVVLDRTLGLALSLVTLPVIGAAALAVRLTSAGPAFYPSAGSAATAWSSRC